MERELWLRLYRMLLDFARRSGPTRSSGQVFSDVVIAGVHLWAVLHDRPDCWACCPANWPAVHGVGPAEAWRPFVTLPSQSCLSRRLRNSRVGQLLDGFGRHLAFNVFDACNTLVKRIDSKPLPVGAYSRARDARWGEATRTQMRGYKLFCVFGRGPMPIAWEVSSMNASDQRVGCRLVRRLSGAGYVLADSGFDPNKFYAACAESGHQGLARRKRPDTNVKAAGLHPHRARAIELLEGESDGRGGGIYGAELFKLRTGIERDLAQLTNTGGGLGGLPNWVRWLPRVHRWVRGKLLFHAIRQLPKSTSYRSVA
jgi:hypothetical protein